MPTKLLDMQRVFGRCSQVCREVVELFCRIIFISERQE